jgi:hypothetical protein
VLSARCYLRSARAACKLRSANDFDRPFAGGGQQLALAESSQQKADGLLSARCYLRSARAAGKLQSANDFDLLLQVAGSS